MQKAGKACVCVLIVLIWSLKHCSRTSFVQTAWLGTYELEESKIPKHTGGQVGKRKEKNRYVYINHW